MKESYQKDCAVDYAECCKYKTSRRKEKTEPAKKKEEKKTPNSAATVISKIPSTIQVNKRLFNNIIQRLDPDSVST